MVHLRIGRCHGNGALLSKRNNSSSARAESERGGRQKRTFPATKHEPFPPPSAGRRRRDNQWTPMNRRRSRLRPEKGKRLSLRRFVLTFRWARLRVRAPKVHPTLLRVPKHSLRLSPPGGRTGRCGEVRRWHVEKHDSSPGAEPAGATTGVGTPPTPVHLLHRLRLPPKPKGLTTAPVTGVGGAACCFGGGLSLT